MIPIHSFIYVYTFFIYFSKTKEVTINLDIDNLDNVNVDVHHYYSFDFFVIYVHDKLDLHHVLVVHLVIAFFFTILYFNKDFKTYDLDFLV